MARESVHVQFTRDAEASARVQLAHSPVAPCSHRGESARREPVSSALPRGLSRGKITWFSFRVFCQIAHVLIMSATPTSSLNIKAALSYFALVFGAGFAMGAVRVPLVVPRVGERIAELMEMPIMLLVIIFAARFIVRRFALPLTAATRLAVGLLALGLLLSAELLLAVMIQDRSLGEYIASRDPVSGSVYLLMLAVYATMPLILAWRRPTLA